MASMNVYFNVYFSAPSVDESENRTYLKEFLADNRRILREIGHRFGLIWEKHRLSPEPNVLKHKFYDEGVLELPFVFQFSSLRDADLKIDLLKILFENICHKSGVEFQFQYNLEEVETLD